MLKWSIDKFWICSQILEDVSQFTSQITSKVWSSSTTLILSSGKYLTPSASILLRILSLNTPGSTSFLTGVFSTSFLPSYLIFTGQSRKRSTRECSEMNIEEAKYCTVSCNVENWLTALSTVRQFSAFSAPPVYLYYPPASGHNHFQWNTLLASAKHIPPYGSQYL